jgi:hypothetical protein
MNRAQELRAKKKEVDFNQDSSSDLSSLASQSEIQRQRRSKQLEATQKLLDGQVGGLKSVESSSGRSLGTKSFGDGGNGQQNVNIRGRESALNHDEQPVGGSSNATHSIISQKQLGNIHRQYQPPVENNPMTSRSDISAKSSLTAEDDILNTINESKRVSSSDKSRMDDDFKPTLREMPLEGRGRGRGRGRSNPSLSGSTDSLGEVFGTAGSLSRGSAVDKEEVGLKSRSPWTTRIHSSPSQSLHSRPESVDAVTKSLQSYLKSRQVPEFKEGDCAKLTILRQRLVARRRKREISTKAGSAGRILQSSQSQRSISTGAESNLSNHSRTGEISRSDENSRSEEGRKREISNKAGSTGRIVQSNQSQRSTTTGAESSPSNYSRTGKTSHYDENSRSGEGLNPNDYTAADFQKPPIRPNDYQDSMTPLPGMQSHKFGPTSMDKSQTSDVQNDKVNGGDDDEVSVVNIELIQCDCCKRKFAPKIYEKHFESDGQPKCAKIAEKKRPVYNGAMVRIANNDNLNKEEQMLALQVSQNTKAPKKKIKKSSKWREESGAFREAMKANRLVSQAEKKEEVTRHKKHGKPRSGR